MMEFAEVGEAIAFHDCQFANPTQISSACTDGLLARIAAAL